MNKCSMTYDSEAVQAEILYVHEICAVLARTVDFFTFVQYSFPLKKIMGNSI